MIKTIEVLFYKGFKYSRIELQHYNILVGPNASGKSSFLDVLRFIRDMLNDGPVSAIKKRSSGFRELLWNQSKDYCEFALEFMLPVTQKQKYKTARYEIALAQNEIEGIVIEHEQLWLMKDGNGKTPLKDQQAKQLFVFPTEPEAPEHIITLRRKTPPGWRKVVSKSNKGNDYFRSENTEWNITYRFGPQKASLARIPEDENRFPIALWLKNVLMEGIEFIQLNSEDMRWACRPDSSIYFEPTGSNIPKVIRHLEKNHPDAFTRWVEHIKTTLGDIKAIEVKERPEDRYLYLSITYNNDTEIPSWLLSDGTLRLLAQTLIAYLPVKDKVYMIEEPENGLHPQAIETAIQSLSSVYDNTVMLASHSPVVLRLSEPRNMLCFSKTDSGAIDIVRGHQHPKLKDWKKDVDLATLHAAGVLQ